MSAMETDGALLKHFLAAIAYRTQKALRGAPAEFADFHAGNNARTPHELVWHMTGVLGYAGTFFEGGRSRPEMLATFQQEIQRFHETLADLARLVEGSLGRCKVSPQQLLQGPLSDVMTHAGQLALLRRLSGSPIAPENFVRATISAGNLGPEQPAPVAPDPGWSPDLPPQPPGKGLPKDW